MRCRIRQQESAPEPASPLTVTGAMRFHFVLPSFVIRHSYRLEATVVTREPASPLSVTRATRIHFVLRSFVFRLSYRRVKATGRAHQRVKADDGRQGPGSTHSKNSER